MLLNLIAFLSIGLLIFFATTTVEKNPQLRIKWMLVGCTLFFTGSICLIVNSVGLTFGFLQWIDALGILGSFLFKLALIFGGILIVILVNHNPDAYDEYFDGNKYN
jgi:hypothetical protein